MTTQTPSPTPGPTAVEELWQLHRRRMLDIGYRMLGSISDAEDVAGEAYTRLIAANLGEIDDPVGWLVTVTSRLCLDRIKQAEHRKRAYVGPWLPEPLVDLAHSAALDPADRITLDDSVRMALLVMLEKLSPAERTAFVLHDLFAISFVEVGEIVGRSPAACRQLASRARRRIQIDEERPRVDVSRTDAEAVAQRFAHACSVGELAPLLEVLDPAIIGDFDSGGEIPGAPLQPVDGAGPVARTLLRAFRDDDFEFVVARVNGEPGVIVQAHGDTVAVIALGLHNHKVDLIHAVGNPAKLQHLHRSSSRDDSHPI